MNVTNPNCPTCGASLAPGVQFCEACGARLEVSTAPHADAAPSVSTAGAQVLEGDYAIPGGH